MGVLKAVRRKTRDVRGAPPNQPQAVVSKAGATNKSRHCGMVLAAIHMLRVCTGDDKISNDSATDYPMFSYPLENAS